MSTDLTSNQTDTTQRWLTPRIWRNWQADFHNDAATAGQVYTQPYLESVQQHGFDAIWVRGRLRDLMDSTVLPQLNRPGRQAAIQSLQTALENTRALDMKLYLFFNEPLALKHDDPFWQQHPELRGAGHISFGSGEQCYSLCTSVPIVRQFMADAIDSVVRQLPGLGGVILITASEHHAHCWSHHARFGLDDGIVHANQEPLDCPRCRDREPADVVAELISIWEQTVHAREPQARILAWNWSWSMWYPEPQREVIDRLPAGVELMADFERGDQRQWQDMTLPIDEYSLSFVGPSRRFQGSHEAAKARSLPTHAKLQIGNTHEMATVPNLPLVPNLHQKLVQLHDRGVAGAMCTWAIGCRLTLNTFAMGLFASDPDRYRQAELFYHDLANRYLGLGDATCVTRAWQQFSEAFDLYPFSIRFLYFGPINLAPAIPLLPEYRCVPLEGTWKLRDDYGDQYETSCHPFSLTQAATAFGQMADLWDRGLTHLQQADQSASLVSHDADMARHRREEWSTARMIGIQLRSTWHLLRFHEWRLARIAELNLTPPCDLPMDDTARQWIELELANITPAVALTQQDARLGFHDEAQGYMYNPEILERKISRMQALLAK